MGKRRGASDAVVEPEPEETAPVLALDPNYDDEAAEGLASIEPRDLAGRLERIELEHILDSPTQPRKSYDDAYLRELAKSIARTGLQQPPVVRELPDGRVELVVGHCRTRAARLAGLHEIDVIVREMSDEEVAVAQLAENIQRQDLTPIDEAEALQRLVSQSSARQVALDLGISLASIYARLKLLDLIPAARDLLVARTLSPSVAVLLARVPAELQQRALEDVMPQWNGGHEVSVRDAEGFIAHYMRRLSDAPWALDDVELVPLHGQPGDPASYGGACSMCPQRSDDQSDRGAAGKQRVCLFPTCFALKLAAHNARRVADARAGGATVLEGAAASKALESQRFVEASERARQTLGVKALTWGEVAARAAKAGDNVRPPVLAVDERGELHELHERKYLERSLDRLTSAAQADAAAKAKGVRTTTPNTWFYDLAEGANRADEREREAAGREEDARRARLEAALVAAARKAKATDQHAGLLLELLAEGGFPPASDGAWGKGVVPLAMEGATWRAGKVSVAQAVVWGLLLFAFDANGVLGDFDEGSTVQRVCKAFGVDPDAPTVADARPAKRQQAAGASKPKAKGKGKGKARPKAKR